MGRDGRPLGDRTEQKAAEAGASVAADHEEIGGVIGSGWTVSRWR
jgi:hypothetical protein